MKRVARIFVAAPAAVLLGWLSLYASGLAQAGDISFDTTQALNEVLAGRASLSDQALGEMHQSLQEAAAIVPGDPTLRELMGVVDARRSDSPEFIAEAGTHFVQALQLRPVSPYTWAALAAQKYRVGDVGPSFERSLVNAAWLGPNEAAVQATVANYGLAVWSEVATPTRDAIDVMVARGMKSDPAAFLRIADRRGRLDVACHHFRPSRQVEAKWNETCQSMEATS